MTAGRTAIAVTAILTLLAATACTAGAPSDGIPPSATREATSSPTASTRAQVDGFWRVAGAPATLASGLQAPWSVVPLTDGGALISQRDDGAIVELTPDGGLRAAGVVPGVVSGGESGLHGLALREQGDERWLYAYHGASDDNRVVRMPLLGEPGELSLGEAEVIVDGIARASTHDGGRLAFGPDGWLYVTTGDAQNRPSAQDPASLNGKILRLTPDGEPAPDNPSGTAVYTLGHRNVQGIAWTSDGTMWASEFGQNTFDELNRIDAGANYGWPIHEGIAGEAGFTDPVVTWATDEASPSGIAAVGDTVFLAGLRGERLWLIDTSGGAVAGDPVAALAGEQGRLRDAVAAPDGSLWVLTSNTDGRGAPRAGDDVLLRLSLVPQG
jgi:glucose/arabinose dehydrogenase